MIVRGKYLAKIVRACDGDTVLAEFACPTCGVSSQQRLRLARIDAPELDGPRNAAALWSKQRLNELVGGKEVEVLVCQKWPDKYGRIIVELTCAGVNVSNQMLDEGLAAAYDPVARHVSRAVADVKWLRKFHEGAGPHNTQVTGDGASIVK
jgi:endonuclease YncB( thermonuclease family)